MFNYCKTVHKMSVCHPFLLPGSVTGGQRAVRIRWNIDKRAADRIRVCCVQYRNNNCDSIVIIFCLRALSLFANPPLNP